MGEILLGAVAMACFTASLFFLRFWKTTRDRFFIFFAASFLIEGIERLMVGLIPHSDEQDPLFYCVRLLSFLMIAYAVLHKNGWLGLKPGKEKGKT